MDFWADLLQQFDDMDSRPALPIMHVLELRGERPETYYEAIALQFMERWGLPRDSVTILRSGPAIRISVLVSALDDFPDTRKRLLAERMALWESGRRDE